MSPGNLFPMKFWKFQPTTFWWGCYDSKILKIIISHLSNSENHRSELSSHQMYSKMLRQFSKGSLISISSESLKIHLLIKVLYRSNLFNLSRQYSFSLNVSFCYKQQWISSVLVLRSLDIKCFSFANVRPTHPVPFTSKSQIWGKLMLITSGILIKIFFLRHKCIN